MPYQILVNHPDRPEDWCIWEGSATPPSGVQIFDTLDDLMASVIDEREVYEPWDWVPSSYRAQDLSTGKLLMWSEESQQFVDHDPDPFPAGPDAGNVTAWALYYGADKERAELIAQALLPIFNGTGNDPEIEGLLESTDLTTARIVDRLYSLLEERAL